MSTVVLGLGFRVRVRLSQSRDQFKVYWLAWRSHVREAFTVI